MGEKGNITSDELAAVAAAQQGGSESGVTAVLAGAGTTVTTVIEQTGSTVRDKVIDKAADAAIAATQKPWRERTGRTPEDGPDPAGEPTEAPR